MSGAFPGIFGVFIRSHLVNSTVRFDEWHRRKYVEFF
jgi:hypothetical protein